jgi:MATE family multidrug resistance protein
VGTIAILFVLVPDMFLMAHFAAGEAGEFDGLRDTSVVLLRFVACYTMLDMAQIVFVNAIKGAGDTRFVLLVTILLSGSAVTLGVLGQTQWNWELYSFWTVLTVWICSLGVIYMLRFLSGKWRKMRVIEQEYLDPKSSSIETSAGLVGDSSSEVVPLTA